MIISKHEHEFLLKMQEKNFEKKDFAFNFQLHSFAEIKW